MPTRSAASPSRIRPSGITLTRTAALALLAACGSPARPSTGPAPGVAAPSELRQAWQDAFNRADTAALVALYADDAVLVPPSGTVLTGGGTAARATVGRLMEDRTLRLGLMHQRATAASGHLQGTWQARPRGGAGVTGSGMYFMVVERRTDGRWTIVYHVWRDDPQPGISRDDPAVRQ